MAALVAGVGGESDGPKPHQVVPVAGCRSAAEGFRQGLARARHPLVVCVHQDVYLPHDWPRRFLRQYRLAERQFGPVGVLGVYGVRLGGGRVVRAGHVVDRDQLLCEGGPLPQPVDTLDELLLALPRQTPLEFDPRLGVHFYGADLCLQARRRGLACVAIDAPCLHHSRTVTPPPAFFASARVLIAKWGDALPLATSCVRIDPSGGLHTA